MEVSREMKLKMLNDMLINLLQEEYSLKTQLSIAVEVKNTSAVERLNEPVLITVQSIDAVKKRIAELEVANA